MKTKISDLIDFRKVDALFDRFNEITGFVSGIVDTDGKLLSCSGWRKICTEFHRVHPETSKNCTISNSELTTQLAADRSCHYSRCLNGLVDVAVPLFINGDHVANLFSGQFFLEKPDQEMFLKQAQKYGFNENEYLKALSEVPVVSEEQVKAVIAFLHEMTQFISEQAYQKMQLVELSERLRESERRLEIAIQHPGIICAQTGRDLRYSWIPRSHADFNPQLIVGKRDDEIADNDGIRHLVALKQRVLNSGLGERKEITFPLSDGQRTYDVVANPLFGDSGQVNEVSTFAIDITERKQAEKELIKTKERAEEYHANVEAIIEGTLDSIWAFDQHYSIIYINRTFQQEFEAAFGVRLEKGSNLVMALPEPLRRFWKPCYDRVLTNERFTFIDEVETKIGTLYIEVTFNPIVKNGIAIGGSCFGRNITERMRAEEKLRVSEERFRVVQEISPDGYTVLHPIRNEAGEVVDFTWIYENQTIARINGTDPEEVIGKRLLDLFPDHAGTPIFEAYIDVANSGNTKVFEEIYVGEIITLPTWLRIVIVSMGDDIVILAQDITSRKQTEVALRESEERFKSLHNASFGGIAIHDRGIILDCNQGLSEMTGYTVEELTGMNGLLLIAEKSRDEVLTNITAGYEKPYEVYGLRKNGTEYPLRLEARNVYYKGKPVRTVEFRDITEIRRAEEVLKESEKSLRDLNAQKDRLFSIISHDLRSPFNSILGFSQMLVEQIKENDYKGVDDYARFIFQSSERAMALLTNLLEWSQIQTGRIGFYPEFFDLVSFIEEILPVFEDVARQKSILINRSLPQGISLYADRQMISTILRNLVANAIKFTRQGGTVIVVVRQNHQQVTVAVKDNGVGIPKERLENLFRFDESESTPGTANEKGTGLGLSLCKEFVKKNGGTIWVESEEGKGSTFTFALPLHCPGGKMS